jgi:hypothetical protein
MLVDCGTISVKKGDLYLKFIELDLVGSTGDVEEPTFNIKFNAYVKGEFEEILEL